MRPIRTIEHADARRRTGKDADMAAADDTIDADQPGARAQERAGRRPQTGGGYLFIPKPLQSAAAITWLRRTHAWTGWFGAMFFFFLGLSAVYLNHRAVMAIPQGSPREVAALDVAVAPGAIGSEAELVAWMQSEFAIDNEPARGRGAPASRPGGPVTFNGETVVQPAEWAVSFRGPNATVTGSYIEGANTVHVSRTDAGFIRMIIDLHKVVGVNAAFILLMDAMAGAMMFMSVTGILLWTRLHGPRVAAVGIFAAVLAAAAVTLSGTWVGWAAP
jgi:hypothetical protein